MKYIINRAALLVTVLALAFAPAAMAGFEEAMNLYKQSKFVEAAKEFQALIDEHPDYSDGHFMFGVCLMKTAKPGDAQKAFRKAIELNPDKFVYHYNLANAFQVKGDYGQVINTLNKAEKLMPESQKLAFHKLRGFAFAAQKRWDAAVEDLEKAAKLKSEGPTLTQLGKAYFALGQTDESVKWLRQAVKLQPDAESHRLLGESFLNMAARATSDATKNKHYADALAEGEATLKLDSKSTEARYLVGRAALGARSYDKAIAAFSEVLERKPNHCNVMANLAKAYTAKKDWNNALVAAENATVCDSGLAIAWENKGFILQKMGTDVERQTPQKVRRYREAIEAYERASSIKPSGAIAKAIDTCNNNIDVIEHNVAVDDAAKKQQEEIDKARLEFEEAKRKEEEWKKKQEDD